jgi:hypothetical protein
MGDAAPADAAAAAPVADAQVRATRAPASGMRSFVVRAPAALSEALSAPLGPRRAAAGMACL